jgi:quaternary ammonium compound-resistance protein SugE
MAWFLLFLAGIFECGWAIGLKYTDGFTRPLPTALTVISMIISVVLLGLAVKSLPIGTAYAIWTGIGTVCIMLIVAGIAGLKLTT